jgi:ABC-type methionine transport system ATPase subunit
MVKRQLKFVFPPHLIQEPLIYQVGQQFKVVTNILRASVDLDKGWVILELAGDEGEMEKAISWMAARGVGIEEPGADS